MRKALYYFFGLIFCSCTSQLASQNDRYQQTAAIDDVQTELADMKHSLNGYHVDLRILEEKLQSLQATVQAQSKQLSKPSENKEPISALERRIAAIEKTQEKIAADIRQLSTHANQTSATLVQYKEKIHECEQEIARRFDEVSKLKGTLTSISKAMKQPAVEINHKTYKVKSGDSLEKIARIHHCSVERLKQTNQIENDRIVIGQELKIPSNEQ